MQFLDFRLFLAFKFLSLFTISVLYPKRIQYTRFWLHFQIYAWILHSNFFFFFWILFFFNLFFFRSFLLCSFFLFLFYFKFNFIIMLCHSTMLLSRHRPYTCRCCGCVAEFALATFIFLPNKIVSCFFFSQCFNFAFKILDSRLHFPENFHHHAFKLLYIWSFVWYFLIFMS